MMLPHTESDKLARSLLAKQGVGAIWKLHQAAAAAHRAGFRLSAADLIEVAKRQSGRGRVTPVGKALRLMSPRRFDEPRNRSIA